jgi:hypothetical protein
MVREKGASAMGKGGRRLGMLWSMEERGEELHGEHRARGTQSAREKDFWIEEERCRDGGLNEVRGEKFAADN